MGMAKQGWVDAAAGHMRERGKESRINTHSRFPWMQGMSLCIRRCLSHSIGNQGRMGI